MGGGGSRRHGSQSVLRILIHKIWGYLIHTTIKLLELAAMTGFDHLTSKEIKGIEDKVPHPPNFGSPCIQREDGGSLQPHCLLAEYLPRQAPAPPSQEQCDTPTSILHLPPPPPLQNEVSHHVKRDMEHFLMSSQRQPIPPLSPNPTFPHHIQDPSPRPLWSPDFGEGKKWLPKNCIFLLFHTHSHEGGKLNKINQED